jgi:tRNA A37 threonylcarbamoyladenosine biosynthesis protein TsaE
VSRVAVSPRHENHRLTRPRFRIRHIDLYRLSGTQNEIYALDLDFVFRECISLVEWPSRLPTQLIPPNRLEVRLTILHDSDAREAVLIPHGDAWNRWLDQLVEFGFLDDLIVD